MLKFFRVPFAQSGDKTAIPDAVDVNGFVSYSAGYGFDYQRQKTDPAAKDIERDKMNELFYDITAAVAEIQSQGVPDFITSALNGGTAYSYAANTIVRYSGALYISLSAANTALPTDAAKWALLPTPERVRDGANVVATVGGTADAITLALTPTLTALTPGPTWWRAAGANTSVTPTVDRDGLGAKTLVKGSNTALAVGDIPGVGAWMVSQYDPTLDKEVLLNPAFGVAVQSQKQIQSVSATVGANALTIGTAATSLDFRNVTLTNGAPLSSVAVGALSLTVPSGATLGTINSIAARLVLLVAYNAGSPVLCIANLAGGVNLDETTLISPTTISAGATSAGAIYSASAVGAGSPFRVVGFVDITEATAGTWTTAPTIVQGIGGQALAAMATLGYGQTWQNVTGGRAFGTTYYNTTGRPIFVLVQGLGSTNAYVQPTVNGVSLGTQGTGGASGAAQYNTMTFVVPPGGSYSATNASQGTLGLWAELR